MRSVVNLVIAHSVEDHVTAVAHATIYRCQLAMLDNFLLKNGSPESIGLLKIITVPRAFKRMVVSQHERVAFTTS